MTGYNIMLLVQPFASTDTTFHYAFPRKTTTTVATSSLAPTQSGVGTRLGKATAHVAEGLSDHVIHQLRVRLTSIEP